MNLARTPLCAALTAALLVSGCALGPDHARPATNLPAQYGEAAPSAAEAAPVSRTWWKLFQDATLDGLVEQALRDNTDLQLAVARIEEADGFMREVGAALLPEIDLGGTAARSRVSEATATPLPSTARAVRQNLKLTLSSAFELDFWGKLRRASEAARAQALASRYGRDTVELTLAGLVVQSYLALRAIDAQLAVSGETLASREAALRIARSRFQGGLASQLDVQQAEGARAALAAQVADLRRQRSLAEHQLAFLTGRPDLKFTEGDLRQLPLPPVPPAGLPSSLLEARPDVRQAEAQLAAANARIGVAKAALFPSISLTGSLGGESKELSDLLSSKANIWSLGVGLNLPIFDAGRLSARVDQATAQQKQALAGYQKAVQVAFKEVNDALATLRQTAEGEQALEIGLLAGKKTLALAEARYQAGYSPYLEVLDAQRTQNDATLAFIRNRQTRLAAAVDLFKAIGGGWNDVDRKTP